MIIKKDTIVVHFKVDQKVYEVLMNNILHVLNLTFNLVSLTKLDQKSVQYEVELGSERIHWGRCESSITMHLIKQYATCGLGAEVRRSRRMESGRLPHLRGVRARGRRRRVHRG